MRRVALALCLAGGCDSLAGHEYVGEPMFTLVGTLESNARTADDPVGGLALMWQDTAGPGGPGVAATAVPVAIEFPTTFRVAVPLPPPDQARFGFDDSPARLAEAYVFVVADPASPRLIPRGLDRVHVHNLPGPQREASRMVHPPVHRDHRERSGETGDRDRDAGSEWPAGKAGPTRKRKSR